MSRSQGTPVSSQMITMERMLSEREHEIHLLNLQIAELVVSSSRGTCSWSYDQDDGIWSGGCGIEWGFVEGGLDENQMNYCPQCGGKVEQHSRIEL